MPSVANIKMYSYSHFNNIVEYALKDHAKGVHPSILLLWSVPIDLLVPTSGK